MEVSDEDRPSEEIIRRMTVPHCARGPSRCEKCKEAAQIERICLVRVFFDHGGIARPMMEIEREGAKLLLEFDVVRVFEDENEARDYATTNNISDSVI
ncbi:MAG: hypothetical protein ACW99U_13730 [Candidatus Thorarchaeota archaeon]|jgi:hypothetical protein